MKFTFLFFITSAILLTIDCVHGFIGRLPSTRNPRILQSSSPELSDEERDELIQKMTNSYFGSTPPVNPFETSRPNKLDIYELSDLETVWNIHERNQGILKEDQAASCIDNNSVLSIHELITQTLGATIVDNAEPPALSLDWLDDDAKRKIANVRAIASDLDGTLLTSKMTLHPRTKQAIQRSVAATKSLSHPLQWFFPATGKSRKGALDSLGPEIGALLATTPGVFLQGLYCVDDKGRVVFEQRLPIRAVKEVERLVAEFQVSIVAYDGDDLFTTQITALFRVLHERYGEPMPRLLTGDVADHAPGVHKILLIDEDTEKLNTILRPRLEALAAANGACVTQAIPTMLELLPSGCSKALGVQKLCERLGIDMKTQLLAIGDAENDVLLLQQASIGVAVGNACPKAREAADFVMDETNNEGGAGAAIEVFGSGKIL